MNLVENQRDPHTNKYQNCNHFCNSQHDHGQNLHEKPSEMLIDQSHDNGKEEDKK